MIKGYFISGSDTNVGKTIVASILVNKLDAIYYKPIQCGYNDYGEKDSEVVERLCEKKVIMDETFFLEHPLSPNIAAKKQKKQIFLKDFDNIKKKKFSKKVVVEGAGGLQVPINKNFLMSDLIKFFNLPLILVCRTKLGTINHTLMSLEILKKKKIKLFGIVFIGKKESDTIQTIKNFGKIIYGKEINVMAVIPYLKRIDKLQISTLKNLFTNI